MGLDTSHNCWHSSYSSFNSFRETLCLAAGLGRLKDHVGFGGKSPWPDLPIVTLLNHSDCEGEIAAKDCEPLAKALEELLPKLPDTWVLPAAEQWIKGLRLAASKGEKIDFH
jgi:hypothetical protein